MPSSAYLPWGLPCAGGRGAPTQGELDSAESTCSLALDGKSLQIPAVEPKNEQIAESNNMTNEYMAEQAICCDECL